ncbi:MAG TPA: prolyl oligopeptidase family serine peptidase [Cyclobacteriaceae bacterium]|nr:prolyl oligopeptidase family serine peptidase [Cyclobacteriaceae bacterium]
MKKLSIIMLLLSIAWIAPAQKKATTVVQKKPLTHAVYDAWKDIPSKAITPDGNFAAITINPQDGDGKVVFYNLKTMTIDSVQRADNIALSADSRYAMFKIKPQQKIVKELRRLKKKKEDLPKDSLGIFSFVERKTQRIPEVRSYKIPEKSAGWIAYQLEAKKEPKPKPDEKKSKKKINNDENGYTLVLKKLGGGPEITFGYVKDYSFAKWGQGLLFASGGNDSTLKAGVYWYDLAAGKLQQLYEGKSKYKFRGLSISEDGTQTSFLVDTDTTKAQIRHFGLYHWKAGNSAATFLDIEKSMAIPQNWVVSEYYQPLFSKDGAKLFFGSSPVLLMPDTTRLPEEVVQVEIWGGEDQYIYPQQNRLADAERKRTYIASLDLAEKKIMQLGDRDVPSIELGDEGNAPVALGETNVPYRKMITWDPSAYNDIYLFDLKKQMRNPVASRVKGNASLSPKAKYVFWFSQPDTSWFAYTIATEKTARLNAGLKVQFADEENDSPDFPGNYGFAGWTSDDQRFLAYDRYDIWAFDPQGGSVPLNLTRTGRQEKIVFRYIRTDNEERFIDPSKELLLSAFNENTKASGFYKLSLKDGKLTKLMMDNYRFGGTVKAKNAPQILYTRESFREYPDVWVADINFTAPKKITDVNPQMKNYLWGTVELVHWTSLDNIPLSGLLYKPEGFDPKKKYPMLVNFYEKESDNLNAHIKPEPGRSTINKTVYASNGYLVFVPDIVYKIGFPGESARNCVMPGVTSLIEKGFVDEKNIGVQGHSWGGYQIAYLVTRTNLFKAAEAGAPVVNMISAYGGIRWETGLSRMFQYEHTQSRIGGTLWERPMHFIENSPIFFVDKIQTPLLLLANDADGAVPWYQGIEFYLALRRLNKPVWMLNYNGEPHWPVKRENRMDFQTRMMQFFDYYLKGAPEPEWMLKGVPAIEKGIKKGY